MKKICMAALSLILALVLASCGPDLDARAERILQSTKDLSTDVMKDISDAAQLMDDIEAEFDRTDGKLADCILSGDLTSAKAMKLIVKSEDLKSLDNYFCENAIRNLEIKAKEQEDPETRMKAAQGLHGLGWSPCMNYMLYGETLWHSGYYPGKEIIVDDVRKTLDGELKRLYGSDLRLSGLIYHGTPVEGMSFAVEPFGDMADATAERKCGVVPNDFTAMSGEWVEVGEEYTLPVVEEKVLGNKVFIGWKLGGRTIKDGYGYKVPLDKEMIFSPRYTDYAFDSFRVREEMNEDKVLSIAERGAIDFTFADKGSGIKPNMIVLKNPVGLELAKTEFKASDIKVERSGKAFTVTVPLLIEPDQLDGTEVGFTAELTGPTGVITSARISWEVRRLDLGFEAVRYMIYDDLKTGNDNDRLNIGERAYLDVSLLSKGNDNMRNFQVSLTTNTPGARIVKREPGSKNEISYAAGGNYYTLSSGMSWSVPKVETTLADWWVEIDRDYDIKNPLKVDWSLTRDMIRIEGSFEIPVYGNESEIELRGVKFYNDANRNGKWEIGETVTIDAVLQNIGTSEAEGVDLWLEADTKNVLVMVGSTDKPRTIRPGMFHSVVSNYHYDTLEEALDKSNGPFKAMLKESTKPGETVRLTLHAKDNLGATYSYPIVFEAAEPELPIRFELDGLDGKMSYENVYRGEKVKVRMIFRDVDYAGNKDMDIRIEPATDNVDVLYGSRFLESTPSWVVGLYSDALPTFRVTETAETGSEVGIRITATDRNGKSKSEDFYFTVGAHEFTPVYYERTETKGEDRNGNSGFAAGGMAYVDLQIRNVGPVAANGDVIIKIESGCPELELVSRDEFRLGPIDAGQYASLRHPKGSQYSIDRPQDWNDTAKFYIAGNAVKGRSYPYSFSVIYKGKTILEKELSITIDK